MNTAQETEFSQDTNSQDKQFQFVFDGVFFQNYRTGIARLWHAVLTEWVISGFAKKVVVLDRDGTTPKIDGINYKNIARHDYSDLEADRELLEKICQAVEAKAFVSSYYSFPTKTPTILLLYDMIPEVYKANGIMWDEKAAAIAQASTLLSISQNTAKDLKAYYPSRANDQITVAHCATSSLFQPSGPHEIVNFRAKLTIRNPYFLLVGLSYKIDHYKNAALFFEGFAKLPDREKYEIICAGSESFNHEFRPMCGGATIHDVKLSDKELIDAYSGAIALVFPSFYEGFGMPLLEAAACGCPVITCHNSSIPEVIGDAAIFVDEKDASAMSDALMKVQDEDIRKQMIQNGLTRPKLFSWTKTAAIIANKLESLAGTSINPFSNIPLQPVQSISTSVPLDQLRERRREIAKSCIDLGYDGVVSRFTNIADYQNLASEEIHALEWDEEESSIAELILSKQRTDAQEAIRDYLILSMFLPPHMIPILPDFEYVPDKLLAILVEQGLFPAPAFLTNQDMEQKALLIKASFAYLAERIETDPHASRTSTLAKLALQTDINPCLNQSGDDLLDLMQERATVYSFLLEQNKIPVLEPSTENNGRIGVLCSHIGQGASSTFTIALLKGLKEAGRECLLLGDSAASKAIQTQAESLAQRTIPLPRGIGDAGNTIRNLGLEILIYTDPLHDAESPSYLLALHQLAKIQICISSTLTIGGPAMNHHLVSKEAYDALSESEQVSEKGIPVNNLESVQSIPLPAEEDEEIISRKDLGISKGNVLFVSAAHSSTITPVVRSTWMNLVKANPGSRLLLLPFLDPGESEEKRKLVVSLLEMSASSTGISRENLLIMTDIVPTVPHLEAYLRLGDVYLDAFPCGTSFAAARALLAGLPVVALKGETLRETMTTALLQEQGLDEMIATTNEEYIKIACRMAEEKERVQMKPLSLEPLTNAVLSLFNKN